MTIRRLFPELAVSWDSYDAFGSTMAWWFGCSIALDAAGELVPDTWQFSSGAHAMNREEDFEACTLTDYVEGGWISWDDVRHFGNVLKRYRENLARTGRDY